ncbi:C-type lectin domain family 17, member A-like [Dendropsophus ebraccatus]|uniref:C-type lectin domain family 17, member A-like n=1 Tax=Dendropsophus ebraccatus TaxID=150705 RepID=UPI0038318B89
MWLFALSSCWPHTPYYIGECASDSRIFFLHLCSLSQDDDDDDDYENANPCDPTPALPSRANRKMKNAIKDDFALKCMEKPAKQPPSVWTTPQKGINPRETPGFQPPPIGLDFSSGAVNAAFSDISDKNTFPDLEVMPNRNQPRSGRSKMVVLIGLTVIIFIALAGITGFIFLRYITVSAKVTDLEQTASDLQMKAKVHRANLKADVADLNNTMVKLQDMLMVNLKHINRTLESICTLCPFGWRGIGSSCYYVSEDELSWDAARDECYKVNSVLVMIKDQTESDTIKNLFMNKRRYWIGLRRDPVDNHIWKWLDGTQVTFTNWGVNEPNYHSNIEHCGETMSGPWNDLNCVNKLYYICKRLRTC